MKAKMRITLFLLLCLVSSSAIATLAISGTVAIQPDPSVLLRGQTATITYTITNTGDEPLDRVYGGTGYYDWGPTSTIFPIGTVATPPCYLTYFDLSPLPGNPPYWIVTVFFQPWPLLLGESRQCVMELTVSKEAAGPFVQQFGFTGGRGNQSTSISQSVFFGLGQTTAVPALSPIGLIALILSMLAIGTMLAHYQTLTSGEARG
jgi:hypothetical protein